VPDHEGELVVPSVAFTWFDPQSGRYRTQRADTVRVRVVATGTGLAFSGMHDSLAAPLAAIRGGHGAVGSLSLGPPRGSVGLGGLSLLGYAGTLAWAGVRSRRERDPKRARRSALHRLVSSDLARARALAAKGDASGATAVASEALLAAVGVRFGVPTAGRPSAELLDDAATRGASEEERASVSSLLAALEHSAYAPPEVRVRDVGKSIGETCALITRYEEDLV